MNQRLREKTDYLLSKEKGTVFKDPGGKINIALVYPNTYHVGMSNLGFQGIYGLLNDMKDVVCERVFLPEEKDIDEYLRTETELFSMESKKTLNRFDLIAFSISFENDYPNIIKIFELSNIPPRSIDRKSHHPLIIIGGVCMFFNPEPLADFFDVCFIGEAEEMLTEFIDIYKSSSNKSEVLLKSLSVEGLYIPKFYKITYDNKGRILNRLPEGNAPATISKRSVKDISLSKIRTSIITSETEFSEMYLIETMRGCPWNCRFCMTGKVYSPLRRKTLESIHNEINEGKAMTQRIGLIGPSLSDYPNIKDILTIKGVEFSITSLRASPKSIDLITRLKGNKSISIAPEAGTERLRKVIGKNISEGDILSISEHVFSEGIENLRLYFMVGLPTETRDDIMGIISLVRKIREISMKGTVTLSISTFVPKPFTPFQWHPMETALEVKERLKLIKKSLMPVKGIRVFHDVPKYAYMQGLFSLGDRRVSKVLERVPHFDDWTKAAEGINRDFFIFRKKDFQEILPWDFIYIGITKEKLWEEYQESISAS
ncbi:MAG: radical SAM protein [Nitrospirae bacterium]|nr:radical SAM protein [Nitrospirota bacterium]